MAHASATCPYCGDELISMSSSELVYDRLDSHIDRCHPDKPLPTIHPYKSKWDRIVRLETGP